MGLFIYFTMIMEIFSAFSWRRLILCVIISQIVGAIWYMFLFSNSYKQEMKMKDVDPEQARVMMPKLVLMETCSRFLYFIALAIILSFTPGISLWTAAIAYFLAVATTERSAILWSDHSWKLRVIRVSKIAIDTLI